MIPLGIILTILNILSAIIWPNHKLDWINYMAAGMMIAALIMLLMRG